MGESLCDNVKNRFGKNLPKHPIMRPRKPYNPRAFRAPSKKTPPIQTTEYSYT